MDAKKAWFEATLEDVACEAVAFGDGRVRTLMLFDEAGTPRPPKGEFELGEWGDHLWLAFIAWPIASSFNLAADNSAIGQIEMTPIYDYWNGFSFSSPLKIQTDSVKS